MAHSEIDHSSSPIVALDVELTDRLISSAYLAMVLVG